ncbi:hypothetical protein F2P81_012309 [Scophthalmus maximus]|uniref:Uncharacterized protein n=1 Tax=Scophthalmus maximus TaxID=52904 RepID=A0A6A4SU36_SCOMX|nr:hypothetical protein F2P81_012309 [Scophthalmus maximus]
MIKHSVTDTQVCQFRTLFKHLKQAKPQRHSNIRLSEEEVRQCDSGHRHPSSPPSPLYAIAAAWPDAMG